MDDKFLLDPYKSIRAGNNWYRNIQSIGKGGNGTVFLITCTGGEYKGEVFAMKVFHKMSSEERKKRFLKEIDFMQDKHHPSIMRQYDNGVYEVTISKEEIQKHPFVIIEYLPHTLFNEVIRQNVSIGKGIIYSLQLLSALKLLKSLNIIHRDIKPQNIFINNYSAILGDFGLIKKIDNGNPSDIEDVKPYIAMPHFYRTPELVNYANGKGDLRIESDVFQLGLVLAFMFTQWNPLIETENHLDEIELTSLNRIPGQYGDRIRNIINLMLKIDPDERISVDQALDRFNSIFELYSKRKIKLEGKIFG